MAVLRTNISNTKSFSIEDAQKSIQFKQQSSPNFRYIVHRLMGFSPEEYTDMEYDLSESVRIIDTEALVAETFRKKRQLILKNGFTVNSKNESNLAYIRKRIQEMEFVSQQSFKDLLSEIVENMVNFNNCFILKYRKEDSSSGEIRSLPSGKEFKPIAAMYVLAAPTIDTANDKKTGQIIKYRHRITEQYSRKFKPQDIYHIHANKRVGVTIATPPLEAVKSDIIELRSIEQMTADMIYKNASPFIHVKVGTDNAPARVLGDGSSEIDIYSQIIDNMEQTGGVATPHRVDIKQLGAESSALRLEGYLSYFQNRVLAGLSVSINDLGGAGANDGIYQSLREDIRSYQDVIESFVTDYIFTEILLESPKYRGSFFIPEEDKVRLEFFEADEDAKIKMESHLLNLFVSGLITKEAAIRGTRFSEKDLQPTVITPDQGSNNNQVKSTIRNNINPQNQHTDKNLTIKDNKTYTKYFDKDYNTFLQNISILPLENIKEQFLIKLHSICIDLRDQYSIDYVNQYIEETIIKQL